MDKKIVQALDKIREIEPFIYEVFSTFTIEVVDNNTRTSTNGKTIVLKKSDVDRSVEFVTFALLHEALHNLLGHSNLMGTKDPLVFNYATDVVVNEIILRYPINPGTIGFVTAEKLGITGSDSLSLQQIYDRILPLRSRLFNPGVDEDMVAFDPIGSQQVKTKALHLLQTGQFPIQNELLYDRLEETYVYSSLL